MNNSVYLLYKNEPMGELIKDTNGYKFRYLPEYKGKRLIVFPEDKEYHHKTLFPIFSCRLPYERRPDIQDILEEYGMTEYDEFELLKRSGAKLPTDDFEFIEKETQ